MDHDHTASMMIPLGECSDEQLLAEVARRKLDLHDKITDAVVKETYDFGKVRGLELTPYLRCPVCYLLSLSPCTPHTPYDFGKVPLRRSTHHHPTL
jgi:hypothetical protein